MNPIVRGMKKPPLVYNIPKPRGSLAKTHFLFLIFQLALVFGIYLSIREYYYSDFQKIYWSSIGVLVMLFMLSKIYTVKISSSRFAAFLLVAVLHLGGWYIIPYYHRFGIFIFALICFLYAGMLIYHTTRFQFVKVLFLLALAFSSLNLTALLYFIAEKTEITRPLVNTLFITNSRESQEYILGKLSLLHLGVFVVFGIGAYFLLKSEKDFPIRKKLNLFIFPLFGVAFLMASLYGPIGFLCAEYYIHLREHALFRTLAQERKQFIKQNPFTVVSDSSSAQKVMIIVGESLNRDFMSLYGYPQNTTPELVKLSKDSTDGTLFHFTNVISPEATTVPALRVVLTSINTENKMPFEKSISLVDLFDRAGYESFWVSNQAPLGEYDTPNSIISASADHSYFTANENTIMSENATTGNYYDEKLLNVFDKYSNQFNTNDKQVYFIHLMGSHWSYSDRYPARFNSFKSTRANDPASYLNSVRYNDTVVSELIKQAQEKQFDVVCYFSDHGEDMQYQHNQGNYRKSMSTIPLLVYLSREYMQANPSLKSNLIRNKNTPAMMDNFFHDIQSISGFRSSIFEARNSFITDQYQIRKRKVVEGTIPFD